jgi:hypothetical protein
MLSVVGYVASSSAEMTIELRWAGDREERMPELVADLIRRRVAVIATPNAAGACRQGRDLDHPDPCSAAAIRSSSDWSRA